MKPNSERTPNPPFGYSRDCLLPEYRQVELVAEFHAYRIRPSRIAYRLGIDIALVDDLLAGDRDSDRFTTLVKYFRKRRLNQRLVDADKIKGQTAYEQRQRAVTEFETQSGI